ncbi:FAD binding domain-containing protein [Chaetomium tenue]|uniref:FAD binding domain-containing protein n=1 Tax=Chaetomium tenue TaxID=1854479 RepID=A0ACB7PHU5_9PEZI|nr:FAD binding domain-containing protein [Chaetomium globosum]
MTYDCDVLIVGAGPVGTALALELALHRVSCRIIDREPIRNDKSRALVMQPRTLELLNRHGAADAMVKRGRILRGMQVYIKKKIASNVTLDDLGTTDTEFTLPLNVSQVETERFLETCLDEYNIKVERPVAATGIIQDDSGVTVTLERPDGKVETIRSKYVVGCDGAHSTVRHASDKMTFPGGAYPQDYVLCDTRLRDSCIPLDRLSLALNNKGIVAVFPMANDVIRVVASRSSIRMQNQEEQATPTLAELQAYFTTMTPAGSGTLDEPTWLTRFRLHHRCVSQYRDGRLFVAGDAAHIHSPAGGQGMNAGIQDAINLGWKLAHALALQTRAGARGDETTTLAASATAAAAADALLDSYDLERRPVGLALLRGTDRLFTFMATPGPFLVHVRDFVLRHVAPRVSRSAARRRQMFLFMSQFGVNYRGCTSLVGEAGRGGGWFGGWFGGAGIRGGDRLPDGVVRVVGDGEKASLQRVCVGAPHHLLLFSGDAARGGRGEADLARAAESVVRACWAEVRVHYIAGDERAAQGEDWYTDPRGELHRLFGFGKKAGYVLVRPDGYVAHIGPLAKLPQLLSFLEGYLVSSVVTPRRARFGFVYPLAWAVAGACLAVNRKWVTEVAQRLWHLASGRTW